jgi:hypothetical protein
MVRVLEQLATLSQKRVVHAPGIHPDSLKVCFLEIP